MNEKILEVNNHRVTFDTYAGKVQAVRGVSFYLNKGETLAVVGESGCGKSVTFQSLIKLTPSPPARIQSDSIKYNGKDIAKFTDRQMESLRGKEFSMIFQDPMTSLNPTMRVGRQITEGIRKHQQLQARAADERAINMLKLVGIPSPQQNMLRYPHTYSGGMRQRIMIAIALACNPNILIADEPTTALDVTMQAQILELMNDLKDKLDTAIVLITHDLGVVARMAQRVAVMYAGQIVETGRSEDIFYTPRHPYTWGLLGSMPMVGAQESNKLNAIPGTPPDLFAPPPGCAFAARCPHCLEVCREVAPPEFEVGVGHKAACWLLDSRAPKVAPPRFERHKFTSVEVSETQDGTLAVRVEKRGGASDGH
ncbi:MAG: ABC transporter ATP-binding protein [Firmicutes bacterium]|nr:ABC transporter ATP-binding protein [Bacillota bacterium]